MSDSVDLYVCRLGDYVLLHLKVQFLKEIAIERVK